MEILPTEAFLTSCFDSLAVNGENKVKHIRELGAYMRHSEGTTCLLWFAHKVLRALISVTGDN